MGDLSSSFPNIVRPFLQSTAEMNDLQLVNLLTMECARLDAKRATGDFAGEGMPRPPRSVSPPRMFLWGPETTTLRETIQGYSAAPPVEQQNTRSSYAATRHTAQPYLRAKSPAIIHPAANLPAKASNAHRKRSRSASHEIGYVKAPKTKRRPNSWWKLPEYAHLETPTYAKPQKGKSANIRGMTRVQGTATQNTGIRSVTHPNRIESSCDNGTYGGIWPNVTIPPVVTDHIPPRQKADGTYLNVPAWDAGGDVCEYLPSPGQIHTGFDPKWDVRVPAYMTMEAVLGVATETEEDVLGVNDGNRSVRGGRNTGKHAAARELALQQREAKTRPTREALDDVVGKNPNHTVALRCLRAGTHASKMDEGFDRVNRTQHCSN